MQSSGREDDREKEREREGDETDQEPDLSPQHHKYMIFTLTHGFTGMPHS